MSREAPTEKHYVHRRAGHVMISYDKRLFVWGGYMELAHTHPYTLTTHSKCIYHSASDNLDNLTLSLTRSLRRALPLISLSLSSFLSRSAQPCLSTKLNQTLSSSFSLISRLASHSSVSSSSARSRFVASGPCHRFPIPSSSIVVSFVVLSFAFSVLFSHLAGLRLFYRLIHRL
ncbi:hypothetical protein C7M84_001001 [Penaeus vannamei]|uniref:Uncharacterized protein n=1 Tax=Penaeus vannamei TaxID=6689 RepID=A0A3R7MFE5_PENVA|nr:hypothetical protein C7M84_001001 [Penaeus vannamei]